MTGAIEAQNLTLKIATRSEACFDLSPLSLVPGPRQSIASASRPNPHRGRLENLDQPDTCQIKPTATPQSLSQPTFSTAST
jgi:hypothetical protein